LTVLSFLCGRKSILEVEFLEEEGTGLGPTLEFFALVAAEFQRSGSQSCESGFLVIWLSWIRIRIQEHGS
jgi:hypothetical protein